MRQKNREPEVEKNGWWHKDKTGGTGLFRLFFSPFFGLNLACGGTHRLQARWQSWLACFVQKQQRPRQCRIRPYRNPHSLKPGPHPHSLQQSDTQPQPTALDTPGRGSRPDSHSTCKQRWQRWFETVHQPSRLFNETMALPTMPDSDSLKLFTIFTVLDCKHLSIGATRRSQLTPNIICMYYMSQIWGGRGGKVRGQAGGVCGRGADSELQLGDGKKQRMV